MMSTWRIAALIGWAVAAGCSQAHDPTETGGTVDPSNDTSNPHDTDTDTNDTDSDTEPEDTGPDFCEEFIAGVPSPGAAGLGECVTAELQCGDVIESTNEGGSRHYDKDMYHSWACASTESAGSHYDGPERSYLLVLPPETKGYITLEKECDRDLELRVIRRAESDACPSASNNLVFCNRDAAAGGWDDQEVELTTVQNGFFYEVIVDGRNDAIANFRLTVDCD